MTTDVWKTPEEACAHLGEGWVVDDGFVVKKNSIGTTVSKRRIYDGSEHKLARAGMVVFTERELK